MAESGLRPVESLLNNRSRRHVLRLMSLPKGNQAKPPWEAHGPFQRVLRPGGGNLPTGGRTRRNSERAPPSPTQGGRSRKRSRKADSQPGLVLWADGSRDENGTVGYAVAWRKGRSWDTARRRTSAAAIARALGVTADRAKRRKLGRVRIFTDAQAAIKRMTHDEPGPGQTHALQAMQAIAALRKQEPAVEIEIRWCPAHKGIPGYEVVDGWAKQAASKPDAHGVEWLKHADKYGRRAMPPTSLAHLRRGHWRRSGRKPGRGASGDISTTDMCSGRNESLTRPQQGRRSARPHGSTSSSPGMPSRVCT